MKEGGKTCLTFIYPPIEKLHVGHLKQRDDPYPSLYPPLSLLDPINWHFCFQVNQPRPLNEEILWALWFSQLLPWEELGWS